jgi:hypothetical protein
MFDPERDEETGSWRFLRRLLAIGVVTVAACAVLYPSVTGFAAGPDHQIGCLAIKDGWTRDRTMSDGELLAAYAVMPKTLTPDQMRDPAAVARFREQSRAAQASPQVQKANAAIDWAGGPGACVPESRHRLILSGIGTALLLAVLAGAWLFVRTRKNLRRSRIPDADFDAGSVGNALI